MGLLSIPKLPPAGASALVAAAAIASSSPSSSSAAAAVAAELPSNHPDVVMSKFSGHLKCPYASEWMAKGPEAAAEELGMIPSGRGRGRELEEGEDMPSLEGSCLYESQWTGPSCIDFRGDGWKGDDGAAAMGARCSAPGTEGMVALGEGCPQPDGGFAGYCVSADETDPTKVEYSVLALGAGMGCDVVGNACETFAGGTFVAGGECAPQEGDDGTTTTQNADDGGNTWGGGTGTTPSRCAIAPGPIGGAHQDGYSPGYEFDCPGTPAESSPYQWPLRWAANFHGGSILYGTDEVIYQNGGRVFYRLDKNWKRHDFYYQRGYQRSIVQGPCEQMIDEDGEMRCIRDSDNQSIVLHRGNKMIFIELSNSTVLRADGEVDVADIESCSYMDMKIIGNIRPDWFMDKRGASVDVQYLGNQHIYYPTGSLDSGAPTTPRLAKQWRKKDFANHYFTMSMQAHLSPEGVHWPLVLNVPGEGFGDDSIQHYYNHTLLTEEDESIFLLDEAYEAAGGSCPLISRPGGEGGGGPPSLEEPFPSDLEVDENAWYSNVYTFSPVWRPPMEKETETKCSSDGASSASSGVAVKEVGPNTVVESCFHSSTGEVELSVKFGDIQAAPEEPLPWLALAFRRDEECVMTPRGGGDGEVVLIMGEGDDQITPVATYGPLPPAARRFEGFDELSALPLLDAAEGFSHASVERADDDGAVTLRFRRAAAGAMLDESNGQPAMAARSGGGDGGGVLPPEAMHLTYAYGMGPTLGYHEKKGCFEIIDFPACPVESTTSEEEDEESSAGDSSGSGGSSQPVEENETDGTGADGTAGGGQNVAVEGAGTRASDASGKSFAFTFMTCVLTVTAMLASAPFV